MMTEPVSGVEANATAKLEALPRRLDAYLAAAGIYEGVATIDGAPATASQLVYPGEEVRVNGTTIAHKERQSRVHAYHKLHGEKIEAIRPAGCAGLSHVGQLDKKTTGLLLFTDDSELSRLILCPGLLEKTYVVEIDAPRVSDGLTAEQLAALTEKRPLAQNATERRKGRNERGAPVGFESVVCKGSRPIGDDTRPPGCAPKSRFAYEVIVQSGANHVVKRLFDRAGQSVRTLHRSAIGPVSCDVAAGAARALTADEVSTLWKAVGGDVARAALRRASLLCAARSGADERLRAFFGSELDGTRCYAAFPGLSCAHDDVAAPAPKRARGADDAVLL
jgi:pseudouridine synthase